MRIRHCTAALAALTVLGTACRPAQETPGTAYGEALTLTDTTQLAAVLENPDAYIGQQLLLTGTVVNVCEKRGCWLELGGELEHQTLRVKVEDGVIVFPMSARGRQAVVEGVMEKIELTEEEAREQARAHAEEMGEAFDPASVTGPQTIYQLKGLGAVIAE
ncbi:MAG: DUF4920 domain-containing protein [Gemmatimonadales bacterium]|nr:DUF4920 domain-containing protein [Gemmatimonadales bacterium]